MMVYWFFLQLNMYLSFSIFENDLFFAWFFFQFLRKKKIKLAVLSRITSKKSNIFY